MSDQPNDKAEDRFSLREMAPDQLFAVPSTFANRFFITGMGPNIRLTFAEQSAPDAPGIVRGAFTLTVGDAIELRDLLIHMLKDVVAVDMAQAKSNG